MAQITVDSREHKLIALFGSNALSKQLDIGDVHITSDEGVLLAVIERKTLSDLAASRKDGRWDEQKKRLLTERESYKFHAIYVIEGGASFNEEGFTHGLPNKTIITMLLNCVYRYNISVFYTRNPSDTVDFIKAFAKRAVDYPRFQEHVEVNTDNYQESLIKSRRKNNVTNATVFLSQLCAIPGISYKKAEAISESLNVKCMKDLVALLQDKDAKQRQKTLETVPGIGAKIAKDIIANTFISEEKHDT